MHPDLNEALTAAIAAERAAWQKVKDKLPGSPQYEHELWTAWQAGVQRCVDARKALDAAAGDAPRSNPRAGE